MSATIAPTDTPMGIAAPAPAALPSVAAAAYIGVSRKTLSNWRALGEGPRWVRLGSKPGARVVYRVADLNAFLDERVVGGVG